MVTRYHTPDVIQQRCRILELPKELRLHIYEHVLIAPAHICITDGYHRRYQMERTQLQPQILRLCSHIRDEAADILYGSNTFVCLADINRATKRELWRWITQIGPANVALLNHIVFNMVQNSKQAPVVGQSIAMFDVETSAHLRGHSPRAIYMAKYWDAAKPWTVELEPDPAVEAQLELLKRMAGMYRLPLTAYHVICFYDVAMQIRPKLKDRRPVASLREGTRHVLDR